MEVCMQCIPTYRDLCVDGSLWILVGFQIRTCVFACASMRCAGGLWVRVMSLVSRSRDLLVRTCGF